MVGSRGDVELSAREEAQWGIILSDDETDQAWTDLFPVQEEQNRRSQDDTSYRAKADSVTAAVTGSPS